MQAARVCLQRRTTPDGPAPEWVEAALLALRHSLPQLAQTGALDQAALLAAHRQAWQVAKLDKEDPWHELLQVRDPLERFIRALRYGERIANLDLGQLILEAVAAQPTEAHRVAVALAVYLATHRNRSIPGTVVETLAGEIERVIQPREKKESVHSSGVSIYREAGQLCATLADSGHTQAEVRDRYTRNLLQGLLPDGFQKTSPSAIKAFFEDVWQRLEFALKEIHLNPGASQ